MLLKKIKFRCSLTFESIYAKFYIKQIHINLLKRTQMIWHKTNLVIMLAFRRHDAIPTQKYSQVIVLLFLALFGSSRLPIWKNKIGYLFGYPFGAFTLN